MNDMYLCQYFISKAEIAQLILLLPGLQISTKNI